MGAVDGREQVQPLNDHDHDVAAVTIKQAAPSQNEEELEQQKPEYKPEDRASSIQDGRKLEQQEQVEQMQVKMEGDTETSDESANLQMQMQEAVGTQLIIPDIKLEKNNTAALPSPASASEDMAANSQKTTPAPRPSRPTKSKKRAAPKKGPANKTSSGAAAKKRKLDTDGSHDWSSSRGTPATSRASGTPVPNGSSVMGNIKYNSRVSATPTRSSSMAAVDQDEDMPDANDDDNDDDEEYDDETQLFCICRKPDDHGVMIGCDGPCDDWFHLRCVDMNQVKTKLVQKWYCPNCAAAGHETLWKRMCRLPGCDEPAHQEKNGRHTSKYCSDAHGQDYMRRLVFPNRTSSANVTTKTTTSKRTVPTPEQELKDEDNDDEEDRPDNRGGVLGPSELKALLDGVKGISEFHALGSGVLSPPQTASPDPTSRRPSINGDITLSGAGKPRNSSLYTPSDEFDLAHITSRRTALAARKNMLNDRSKFIGLVEARRKVVLAELREHGGDNNKNLKDICGYDRRLIWSEEEFEKFTNSGRGQKMLVVGVLEPPDPELDADAQMNSFKSENNTQSSNETPADGGGQQDDEKDIDHGICLRKRCERHRAWYKTQLQDDAFERELVRLEMARLQTSEEEVRVRAAVRALGS